MKQNIIFSNFIISITFLAFNFILKYVTVVPADMGFFQF